MNPEPSIQIDMFEVQLGASILLQIRISDREIIRVLADGGRGSRSDIRQRLGHALSCWGSGDRRIDLLIGTHYDADHLDGLVPVIDDSSIAIQEAWLPPVANDVERHSVDDLLDAHFLAYQFQRPDGYRLLTGYLNAKEQVCTVLRPFEGERAAEGERIHAGEDDLHGRRKQFEIYRGEAAAILNPETEREYSHADEPVFEPVPLEELWRMAEPPYGHSPYWLQAGYRELEKFEPELRRVRPGSTQAANLAAIRKSAANDAINAISLFNIVNALRSRNIPIRCNVIEDGVPRRFVWGGKSQRFHSGNSTAAELAITLLGPSDSLVRKHWNRLPIGDYANLAMLSRYEIKSITPSNQLSYVAHVAAEEQGILVSGDAGFVDFKPRRTGSYHDALLKALSPLDVVQIAHHGGNAAHFYRVLQGVGYPSRHSFVLLSHATNDKHRPGNEFRELAEDSREAPEPVSILFTAAPLPEKIQGLEDLVHQPVGAPADCGDVRLEYRGGEWQVTKHAVQVRRSSEDAPNESGVEVQTPFPPLKQIEFDKSKVRKGS
jgi:beta-lactamase superfamily II metal-dependent hydrolase